MALLEHTSRSRRAAAVLACIVWVALGIPLAMRVAAGLSSLDALGWELAMYFGYFTILTNSAVALTLTVPVLAPDSRPGRFFRRPGVVTGVAASIALVSITYELLLRSAVDPQGIDFVIDLFLHDLIPISFVAYWWVVTPKANLGWRDPLAWAAYPFAYLLYVLLRGELIGHYPYPFLDVSELGYVQVLLFALGIAIAFLVISWVLVGVGRYVSESEAGGSVDD
jgi:hypothetical protein